MRSVTLAVASTALVVGLTAPAQASAMTPPPDTSKTTTKTVVVKKPKPKPDWRNSARASRGGAGRWHDSNTPVWNGVPRYARDVWLCIRLHESIRAGHYRAQNPYSSASGAGQWIRSTWGVVRSWAVVDGKQVGLKYSEAKYAPAWVQDAVYIAVWKRGHLSMWAGTGCPGT